MNPPLFMQNSTTYQRKKQEFLKKVCDILRAFLDVISLINRKRVRDASIYTSKKYRSRIKT